MKQHIGYGLFAILVAVGTPSVLAVPIITFSQTPDPWFAQENTAGNIGFVTLKNNGAVFVSITNIFVGTSFIPTGGEADDEATNLALISPKPTGDHPLRIAGGGTANLKFSWDAVDTIMDGDLDFGDWLSGFFITCVTLFDDSCNTSVLVKFRVVDRVLGRVPEPATLALFAIGLLGLCFSRRKR